MPTCSRSATTGAPAAIRSNNGTLTVPGLRASASSAAPAAVLARPTARPISLTLGG
jgi:hypothetical protein